MKTQNIFLCLLIMSIAACGGKNKTEPVRVYDVEITNITANQPLSPPGVVLHGADYRGWRIGQMASVGLEMLAEGGDPKEFIAKATDVLASAAGNGVILPGDSTHILLEYKQSAMPLLTVAAMPVNTNDAFSGVTGLSLMHLMPGEQIQLQAPIYDAGTEQNSELAAAIPGPAAMGEGFNSERNDVDYVAMHPGVVTANDGLMNSALNATHRFDQNAMLLTVKRIQ